MFWKPSEWICPALYIQIYGRWFPIVEGQCNHFQWILTNRKSYQRKHEKTTEEDRERHLLDKLHCRPVHTGGRSVFDPYEGTAPVPIAAVGKVRKRISFERDTTCFNIGNEHIATNCRSIGRCCETGPGGKASDMEDNFRRMSERYDTAAEGSELFECTNFMKKATVHLCM